jgi:hypothetical protein
MESTIRPAAVIPASILDCKREAQADPCQLARLISGDFLPPTLMTFAVAELEYAPAYPDVGYAILHCLMHEKAYVREGAILACSPALCRSRVSPFPAVLNKLLCMIVDDPDDDIRSMAVAALEVG